MKFLKNLLLFAPLLSAVARTGASNAATVNASVYNPDTPKDTWLNLDISTLYGYPDNTPPSLALDPAMAGHFTSLGQGDGTYGNPRIVASAPGQFAPGTRIYHPLYQQHYVVADSCGDKGAAPPTPQNPDGYNACIQDFLEKNLTHLDFNVGGTQTNYTSEQTKSLLACEVALTAANVPIVVNPSTGDTSIYPVKPGTLWGAQGCITPLTPEQAAAVEANAKKSLSSRTSTTPADKVTRTAPASSATVASSSIASSESAPSSNNLGVILGAVVGGVALTAGSIGCVLYGRKRGTAPDEIHEGATGENTQEVPPPSSPAVVPKSPVQSLA